MRPLHVQILPISCFCRRGCKLWDRCDMAMRSPEDGRALWNVSSDDHREKLWKCSPPRQVLLLVSLLCFNAFSATPVTAIKGIPICTLKELPTFTLTTLTVINIWVTIVLQCFKIKKIKKHHLLPYSPFQVRHNSVYTVWLKYCNTAWGFCNF